MKGEHEIAAAHGVLCAKVLFFLIYNKLLLNFCLKQIENNGPLINMIYKVLKNSAQGLLSGIHVRLLASELRSSHCFST